MKNLVNPNPGLPCLEMEEVSFAYEPSHAVLQAISLAIPCGALLAITGLNGSGKTTFARHFNGLLRPNRGTVRLFGEDIRSRSISQLAGWVGYVFQNPDHQIFSSSTRQEIAFGMRNLGWQEDAVQQRTDDVLEEFCLKPYAEVQPATLSFGLRRKISIASVYATSPRVLILDEPTAGLDRRSTLELMAILEAYNRQGNTILFITHDLRLVAERFPQCLVLHEGRILFYGETREFFRNGDLLREAQLGVPQITRLAQGLTSYGVRPDILSVAEFCEVYGSLLGKGKRRAGGEGG